MAMQVYTKNEVELSDVDDSSSSSSDADSDAGHEVTPTETVQAAPVPVCKCAMCGATSDEVDWFALIRVFCQAKLSHIEMPTGELCAADGMAMEMFPKFRGNKDMILAAIKSDPEFAALYANIKSLVADRTELSKRIEHVLTHASFGMRLSRKLGFVHLDEHSASHFLTLANMSFMVLWYFLFFVYW